MSYSDSTTQASVGGTFAAWKEQAARIGGRDTMLQYRDSRDGSIELTGAHPSGLAQLLAGRPTRLSSLIRDQELLSDARRRARSIRQKAEQLASERGINTAHLAIGFATWSRDESGGRTDYIAPVMLRHVRLVPRGSRVEDFEIVLDDEITINPALVSYLERHHRVTIDVDEWVEATGNSHGFDAAPVFERLRALAKGIPGLLVNQRLVVSTFANITTPFSGEELPGGHPVLRALAGDDAARRSFGGPAARAPERSVQSHSAPEAPSAGKPPAGGKAARESSAEVSLDEGQPTEPILDADIPGEAPAAPAAASAPAADGAPSGAEKPAVETPGEGAPREGASDDPEAAPADDAKADPIGSDSTDGPDRPDSTEGPEADDSDGPTHAGSATGDSDAADASTADAESDEDSTVDDAPTGSTAVPVGRREQKRAARKHAAERRTPRSASRDDSSGSDRDDTGLDEASAADPGAVSAPTPKPRELPRPLPDRKPQEEFLAIDVDGDQQAVVDAAVMGESVVVDTPPGTGATQVAVAIATTLAHTGRSVLYLAQNSDALGDFASRLERAGLGGFAVDGRMTPTEVHTRLISLIADAERAPRPDLGGLLAKLNDQRAILSEHSESLHRVREPWGVSVLSTMRRLAQLTAEQPGPSTAVRFDSSVVEASEAEREDLRARLIEFSELGAFTLDVEDTVWFGARFASDEDAEAARRVAERAGKKIPALVELVEPLLRQAGLNPARTVDAWGRCLAVLLGVRRTLDRFSPDVYDHNLSDLIAATGSAEYRREHQIEMGMFERNRYKKAAREFLRPGATVDDMHAALLAAAQQRAELRDIAGRDIRPQIPRGLLEADELHQEIVADFRKLEPVLSDTPDGGDLGSMLVEEAQARLQALGEDRDSLADLPARTRIDTELRGRGLGDLLSDLRERRVPHELVGQEFDLAYWATVLKQLAAADPQVGGHDGTELHRVVADYRICDKQYVAAGAARLRYSHGQGWKRAIEEHQDEAQAVRDALRSRHLHVEALSEQAPRVLTALAPVWMMSPFQVPEYFADVPLFDTVIIADAGRMSVTEVLPAIARSKQVIALGDDRLLGPREFSVAVDRRGQRDNASGPSVFGALAEFLPSHRLHTSYRHSPAGLVDLVNRRFYDSTISSLPTALTNEGSGVEFSFVPDALGSPDTATGQVESLDVEVDRVVDLVLKHARTRSRQSLAVVTLTPWHAQRVAAAIQQAIRTYPYVASFFTDPTKEPFVVTDCERIQGMARDAVIFSLGYGRTRQGRVVYNFGALSKPGGERLLAAAVTRARRKLTVVSCFEADDFELARLRHGARVLPGLLADAAAGGRTMPAAGDAERDPLISDIAERLLRSGVYSDEGYEDIDLAVSVSADPTQGMALAVETDGADYAATESIRERERLRAEALARRGWRYLRVWSTDAFVDPQAEADRIFEMWKETVEDRSPQAVLDAARAAAVVVGRQGNRPKLTPGLPLHTYSAEDLDAMVDWIQSDRVSRGDDELKAQLRAALALKGRSRRVESGLDAAVARYRDRYAQAKRSAAPPAEQAGRTEDEVFLPAAGGSVGQSEVMPLYNTGKLREQDLLDAGLRESEQGRRSEEEHAPEAGTTRESTGQGAESAADGGGAGKHPGKRVAQDGDAHDAGESASDRGDARS
ncbi:DUF4011 domain-containing protein [Brevibacterium sp. NPDC049920]|uniref:DUF4011 domain-containing protein n=1 Tax=Brevibacterium sp. NPDC049920 TaxID=3155279 RepID=UPI0033CDF0EE